jgi:uncharacterized protein YbbK (DUF523 family)
MKPVILVSACLLGERCRYDGRGALAPWMERLKDEAVLVPVCPEVLGGLGVPRDPCEIAGGAGADVWEGAARVVTQSGADRTRAFMDGAKAALAAGKASGAEYAIVKSNSPACGLGTIYDGTFSGKKRAGNGVFAELLLREGVRVVSDIGAKGNEWRKSNADTSRIY